MRIALMSSVEFATPLPANVIHAPLTLTSKLADGLVARGHDVTLFAAKGSSTTARCISGGMWPLAEYEEIKETCEGIREKERRDRFIGLCDQYLLSQLYLMAQKGAFDIIHCHPSFVQNVTCMAPLAPTPTVVTLHDPFDVLWQDFLYSLYSDVPQLSFVTISNAQRSALPGLNYAETVYNGIDLEDYPVSEKPSDYLLFAGRLVPEKGAAEAIQVARRANEKLLITGARAKLDYFETAIEPFLDGEIRFVNMTDHDRMPQLYGGAKALLFPVRWEEPFGLVMIEAMACGTPVIAFRRGSVPEIVIDGKTGFIVDNEDEMVAAVKRIDQIDRDECRKHVERNFTLARMMEDYVGVYHQAIASMSRSLPEAIAVS